MTPLQCIYELTVGVSGRFECILFSRAWHVSVELGDNVLACPGVMWPEKRSDPRSWPGQQSSFVLPPLRVQRGAGCWHRAKMGWKQTSVRDSCLVMWQQQFLPPFSEGAWKHQECQVTISPAQSDATKEAEPPKAVYSKVVTWIFQDPAQFSSITLITFLPSILYVTYLLNLGGILCCWALISLNMQNFHEYGVFSVFLLWFLSLILFLGEHSHWTAEFHPLSLCRSSI